MVRCILLPLLLLLAACESHYETEGVRPASDRDLTRVEVGVVCGGATRAEGDGYVAETCTAPVDVATQPATGSGYRWMPGPTEIVSR